MTTIFELPIYQIQPSQLYISRVKLAGVNSWLDSADLSRFTPIPVKALNGRILYTDGHTRAFALYQRGVQMAPVYWDEDELDWEAYQICVDWCLAAAILCIPVFLSPAQAIMIDIGSRQALAVDHAEAKMRIDI